MFKPTLVFASIFACLQATAQNAAPVISNITALADTVFHKLNITFSVSDTENDNLEIFLSVSADSGISYPYNTSNAAGHIGFPVTPGTGRRIEWYYPDSLSGMLPRLSVKLVADDHQAVDIQQIVNQVDTARLKQNLQFIEGIRHRLTDSTHLQAVQDSIYKAFQRYGLQARKHEVLFDSAYTGKNIIGRKGGAVNNTRTYIFDGHYDTVDDSPGADDNGSAIAAMLEVLRVLSPLHLQNTVEFISFDLEEAGLVGSRAFVRNGIQPFEDIAGVINADMIGYYSNQPNSQTVPAGFDLIFPALYARLVADSFRANFIISSANDSSVGLLTLFESMAAQYVPDLLVGSIQVPGNGEFIPDSRRSDHAAFWDSGYVALHVSDGAETRNPNYHGPNDVGNTINYNFMGNVTKAITATLLNLTAPLHADVQAVPVAADPASGIRQMQESSCRVWLYPNPTEGRFKIMAENCNAEQMKFNVYTIEGKLVWQSAVNPGQEVDLTGALRPGYYRMERSNLKENQGPLIIIR